VPAIAKPKGLLVSSHEIEHRAKDGTKKIVNMASTITSIPAPEGGRAMVGLALGLTIPGPERSFMTGRVDVLIQLPCGESDEEIKAQYDRAEELVGERLEARGTELRNFLFGD
jgi:hypothetical protein